MKTSQLVTYLENEIRKHGDREIVVAAVGEAEAFVSGNIVVVSKNERTEITTRRI